MGVKMIKKYRCTDGRGCVYLYKTLCDMECYRSGKLINLKDEPECMGYAERGMGVEITNEEYMSAWRRGML